MTLSRYVGATPKSYAAWQLVPLPPQLPPRSTRSGPPGSEPTGKASAHHCHTFPSISHKPNLFAGYAHWP